jgi:mRNA interferase HigB
MHVIAIKKLRSFWERHPMVEPMLRAWYNESEAAQWRTPQDILRRYRTADILPGDRVVFNIKGNDYRLVVRIHYNTGVVFIRFVGTHAEYDRIDAETI